MVESIRTRAFRYHRRTISEPMAMIPKAAAGTSSGTAFHPRGRADAWVTALLLAGLLTLGGCTGVAARTGVSAPAAAAPVTAPGAAGTASATASRVAGSSAQAQLVREVAAATGKSPAALDALIDSAKVQPSIIAAISRPAEHMSWTRYRPIFVNPARIQAGVAFYRRHQALLQRISTQYGVPPEIIAAIIGVETSYGDNTGNYRVLDALVTLAFHYPPREKFFRGELKTLLELPADKLPGPIPSIYGSYAGAMGLGQFMPSSIAQYAVDADGDGHINLYASLPDAFASIANYFRAHGWRSGQPIAVRADPAPGTAPAPKYALARPTTPLARLAAQGWTPASREDPALAASVLTLDGAGGPEHWLTFMNFYVITRYNHSPMYALAVTELAAAIARGVGSAQAAR